MRQQLAFLLLAACSSSSSGSQSDAGTDGPAATDAGADSAIAEAASSDAPSGGAKRVFVTHATFIADLDTASGGPGTSADGTPFGDVICRNAATAAGLGRTWKAWLSGVANGGDVNAIDRIAGAGGWTLVDRTTVVFADHASLAGTPVHAIDHDEGGQPVGAGECVWTGTVAGGTISASGCNSWTSVSSRNTAMAGDPSSTAQWTSTSDKACDSTCRLYCFEQ